MKSQKISKIGAVAPNVAAPVRKPRPLMEKGPEALKEQRWGLIDAVVRQMRFFDRDDDILLLQEVWGPGVLEEIRSNPAFETLLGGDVEGFRGPHGIVVRRDPTQVEADTFEPAAQLPSETERERYALTDLVYFQVATQDDVQRLGSLMENPGGVQAMIRAFAKEDRSSMPEHLRNIGTDPERSAKLRELILQMNRESPISWLLRTEQPLSKAQEKLIDQWRERLVYSTAPLPPETVH